MWHSSTTKWTDSWDLGRPFQPYSQVDGALLISNVVLPQLSWLWVSEPPTQQRKITKRNPCILWVNHPLRILWFTLYLLIVHSVMFKRQSYHFWRSQSQTVCGSVSHSQLKYVSMLNTAAIHFFLCVKISCIFKYLPIIAPFTLTKSPFVLVKCQMVFIAHIPSIPHWNANHIPIIFH